MTRRTAFSRLLLLIVVAAIVLATLALLVISRADKSRRELPIYGQVPEFEFIDYTGQPFGRTRLDDRISIVYFGFTRCKGPCPIIVGYLKEMYDLYAPSELVQFVMISVDPGNDTLAAMQAYVKQHGLDDGRFHLLRAPVDEVTALCEGGFMLAAEDLPGGHSTKVAIVDAAGRIRSYHNGTDEASMKGLRRRVRHLARELQ